MKIAIIGAGVIGLSTGVRLLETYPNLNVFIFAEKVTPETTSDVAAGLWFPYAIGKNNDQIEKWCVSTKKYLTNLLRSDPNHHKYGIMLQDLYRFSDDDRIEMSFIDKILWNTRLMNETELKMYGSPQNGIAATTFMTQGVKLMAYLMKRFTSMGGSIVRARVESIDQLQAKDDFQVIINCAGLGARELCNDTDLCPMRGQIIKVHAPWVKYAIYYGSAYILPQSDGTVVLGGTTQKNDFNLNVNERDTEDIMNKCSKLLPGLKECQILNVLVGLRPYRSTVRLEKENRTNGNNGNKYTVIHNYGHGGSGLTLFWGCAGDVVDLVKTLIVQARI